jgi:hypothetical protein
MTVISAASEQATKRPLAPRRPLATGIIALLIIAAGWVTAWLPSHPLSAASFVLLWVGFIFAVDSLVWLRRGASLWQSRPRKFLQLFVFSVPVWWLFEALNARVQNWSYELDHPYGLSWSPLAYNIIATICFSTVLPAVMEVASLLTSVPALRPRLAPRADPPPVPALWRAIAFAGGTAGIALALIFPHQAFGMIWAGPMLMLDALNASLGRRSALGHLAAGDWRFIVALPLSALICGFFWEMWNYFSLPKWHYVIPYVGFGKIFEMPVLGYSGYLPFGIELFALYQFLLWITRQRDDALPF